MSRYSSLSDEERAAYKAHVRARRRRLVAAGLCASCGDRRGKSGQYCDYHLVRTRRQQRAYTGCKPKVADGRGRPQLVEEPKVKIGVTATRKGLSPQQREWFHDWLTTAEVSELHHGDCLGGDAQIDAIFKLWRSGRASSIAVHPCTIEGQRAYTMRGKPHTAGDVCLSPKPPLDRNRDIVAACDLLLAFPGEKAMKLRSGTWATVRHALKVGRRLIVVHPDGTTREEPK